MRELEGKALAAELLALKDAIEREEARERHAIEAALPRHRLSARNLAHYRGMRRKDIRRLQLGLAALALSSLGRSEGHVRDTVLRLCRWLGVGPDELATEPLDQGRAEDLLRDNTHAVFGAPPADRHVYIMVTAAEAAEANESWADGVVAAGADLLRINAAHGAPEDWQRIVATFRRRAALQGKHPRVFVDLPGPKLRIEIRQMEETVLHLPRRKDRVGRTVAPTEVPLVAEYLQGDQLPVPAQWIDKLAPGDAIALIDAGGRDRTLAIVGAGEGCVRAQCDRSLFLKAGLPLLWRRGDKEQGRGEIGRLPRRPRTAELNPGDLFLLNATGTPGAGIGVALAFPEPKLLAQVRAGERIVLDDGRIVALAEGADAEGLRCRVQRTVKLPARLRSGKGIAFPDSALSLDGLGEQDRAALDFALEHADGVGVSFVSTARDVARVGERIRAAGKPGFGMILKLETRGVLRNLPAVLFEALKYEPVGLMIARGDLAVELSFERLAEVQEELLWFGEACHMPVIWATQVLDSAAHSGVPTRAEITDAAMAMRAECVMLNRGPYIAAATRMLADIIRKMEAHQFKKRSLMRPLAVAQDATA